jgi:hypothetical protein
MYVAKNYNKKWVLVKLTPFLFWVDFFF